MPHPSTYDPAIDDHVKLPEDPTTTTADMQKMQELMTQLRQDLLNAYAARVAHPPGGKQPPPESPPTTR